MESQKSHNIKAILRSEDTAESFTILDLKLYYSDTSRLVLS